MLDAISRTYTLIDRLEKELGSLDHLCFAFPQVLPIGSLSYKDPSIFVTAAISLARSPSEEAIKAHVSEAHPEPSTYILVGGIAGLEVNVPTRSAKRLMKRKDCLVIERWGEEFVCRVPSRIRDALNQQTLAVVGIPPEGSVWRVPIVKSMQDVARDISQQKVDASL